jgi:hypothetical protein
MSGLTSVNSVAQRIRRGARIGDEGIVADYAKPRPRADEVVE